MSEVASFFSEAVRIAAMGKESDLGLGLLGHGGVANAMADPALLSSPAPRWELYLIGQMRACAAATPLPLPLPRTRKTRAALAVMAMAAPQPVLREELMSLLWSRREPEQARASLRQSVHELQGALQTMLTAAGAGRVVAERHHLRLEAPGLWLDCHAVARATVTRPDALDLLNQALLTDLTGLDPAFDSWIAVQTQRLRENASHVAEAALAPLTDPDDVIAAARRLLMLSPAHEAGWQALMRALAEKGDRVGAVEAYRHCEEALAERAQSQPSTETRALLARIRAPAAAPAGAPALPRPPAATVPRLAVAPVNALDPADRSLSMGLAEEMATALARFTTLHLVTPDPIGAGTQDGGERWRGLGADFLLDGTVRRGAEHVRVTLRLLDMRSGPEVVWTGRFEQPAGDLLALQDEVATAAAAQIDPLILLRQSRQAQSLPMGEATGRDLLLRAIPALLRVEEGTYRDAGGLLARASALAPEDPEIPAWRALWHALLVGQGWAADATYAMEQAIELADRAVTLDPSNARSIAIAAYVRSFVQRQGLAETMVLYDRALALNPSLTFAWMFSGVAHAYAGQHQEAIARAARAKRLAPFDPQSFLHEGALALPNLLAHDYEAAAAFGRSALALHPGLSSTYKGLIAALGHLGRREEAATLLARLDRLEPGFTVAAAARRSALRRAEDLETYLEGLRRAGLPPS